MKRLAFVSLMLCIMYICPAFAASDSSVSVTGNGKEISYSYKSDTQTELAKSIKELFNDFDESIEKGDITQEFTIRSNSNTPVKFSLRLSKPKGSEQTPVRIMPSPDANDDNVLDYYNIIVTDYDGHEVYSYKKADKTQAAAEYKDIELKTLNTSDSDDNATYTLKISVNKALKELKNEAAKLDWLIVSDGYSLSAAVTDAPSETENPNTFDSGIFSKGTYRVGQEIPEGKYEVSGDSNIKVYTASGELKTNIILTTDKNSREGIETYVVALKNGETVELSDDTEFKEYLPSRAALSAQPSPSASPTTRAAKANPKTGDNIPIVIIAILLSAAALGYLKLYKKK